MNCYNGETMTNCKDCIKEEPKKDRPKILAQCPPCYIADVRTGKHGAIINEETMQLIAGRA
jgi:hypothetical protein